MRNFRLFVILTIFFTLISAYSFAQADLSIQNIVLNPEKPEPGDEVQIFAYITNNTQFEFKGTYKISFYIDDVLAYEEESEDLGVKGLKVFSFSKEFEKGLYTLKVVLDGGDNIEASALNNIEEFKFYVVDEDERDKLPKQLTPVEETDLACIETTRPSKADLIPENVVIFFAVFQNQGKEKIRNSFYAAWVLDEKTVARASAKNLPPNLRWKFGLKWEVAVGKHNLTAIVDEQNAIMERDEKNNECKIEFSVHPKTDQTVPSEMFPDRRTRPFNYTNMTTELGSRQVIIDEIDIEPLVVEGETIPDMFTITYVVKNNSEIELSDIAVTAIAEEMFAHSFFINKIAPAGEYRISFVDKAESGKIDFYIETPDSVVEQTGIIDSDKDKK
ncbi:MAG: hypothetical protein JW737_09105 [Acidobacteria bacterium]|nr:hypothetical protein [Acidobacteriota bacterium]